MFRVLLIDDLADRAARLRRLARLNPDLDVENEPSIRTLITEYATEDLAQYDVILVDFNLSGHRPENLPAPRARVGTTPQGSSVEVDVTTGIGVLLYLSSLFESEEFRAVKRAARRPLTSPRLLTFTDLSETAGRLFAAAGLLWFGANHFPSILPPDAAERLVDLADPLSGATYPDPRRDSAAALVPSAALGLDEMLAVDVNGKASSLEARPDTFSWLQIYLRGGGWNANEQPLLDAAFEVASARRGAVRSQRRYWKDRWNSLYAAYDHFRMSYEDVTDPLPTPGDTRARNHDPLLAELRNAALFWTEPDVRAAYELHSKARPLQTHQHRG
ncbi:hypothetical protein [Nocardioides ultimimeridianus]